MDIGETYGVPCPLCGDKVRLGGTGIPARYYSSGYDEERFWNIYKDYDPKLKAIMGKFVKKAPDWSYGLYLWSYNRGTGKTKLACNVMTSIRLMHNLSIRFISVPEYVYKMRNSWKDDSGSTSYMIKDLLGVDILCLDDMGAEKRTEFSDQELFYLIDERYKRGGKTIVTSNYGLDDLKEDTRLADRLGEICIELHMPEQCIRTQVAAIRQQAFLANMGI